MKQPDPRARRSPRLPLVLPLLLAGTGAGAAQAQPAQRPPQPGGRLTFRQAIETALKNGPEIEIAASGVDAAQARVRAAGAQRFPALRAEANILYWDKPLEISFAGMPGMTGMTPSPGTGGMAAPVLRVRDQVTSQASLTLAQPISGLFVLHRLVGLERNGAGAARADRERAKLDTAQRAAEAYLRVLQARALEGVASKSVAQVEAQLQRAVILEKGGALGQVDVLRLTSARDAARQGLLRAQAGATVARAGLVLALDLPAGTPVEPVDDFPDPPPPLTASEGQVIDQALRQRPELAAARERSEQATAGRAVAKAALLPNILGIATYQHTEGQSTFQPKNAWFVGATLNWDLWDWGKNWNGVKEATARARQAQIGAETLRDQVVFEAQRRLLEARTAFETLAVGRSSLQAAEEAYRIQSIRYAEGAATTTDVIDAETDVSRARSSYAQSRYEYYLAQAAVARAVGNLPDAGTGTGTGTGSGGSDARNAAR